MHVLIESLLQFHGEKARQLSDIEATLQLGEGGDSRYRSSLQKQIAVFQNDREYAHHSNEELVLSELKKTQAAIHGQIEGISEEHLAFNRIITRLLSHIDDSSREHAIVVSDVRWFLSQYDQHATKEETILFPTVDKELTRSAWARVAEQWIA